MAKVVQLGLTLMRCAGLKEKRLAPYLNYLKTHRAKIETWDSEEPEDPNKVPKDQLLEPGGFTVWFDKVDISVSILPRTATYLARFECPVGENARDKTLKLVMQHTNDVFELFSPKFEFIDLLGDHPPELSEAVSESRVRWLFWWNYFGSEFVKKIGKSYLEKAPFSKVEELPNGALRCSTRELPFEKMDAKRAKELISYFGGPDRCEIYDAAKHPIDF